MMCIDKSLLVKANSNPPFKSSSWKRIKEDESVSNVVSDIKFFNMMPRFVNTCKMVPLLKL